MVTLAQILSNAGDPLYPELWRACAGPLVTVPRVGDLVSYFPQGHIEQVEASMNQVAGNQMCLYDWLLIYLRGNLRGIPSEWLECFC